MPLLLIIAGYAVVFAAGMVACWSIAHGKHADSGVYWVAGALGCGLVGALLYAGAKILPLWLTIVAMNEAILLILVLLHQAVVSVLESPSRRYLSISMILIAVQLVGALYYTYAVPDIGGRIVVHSTVIFAQAAVSAFVLFRYGQPELGSSVRSAGWIFVILGALEAVRVPATFLWPPPTSRLDPGVLQDFFVSFICIVVLACCFSVVWMALCARRRDLQTLAATDALSGLMNRRAFGERLGRELRRSQHDGKPVSLLMIDLDHFKQINDKHGHLVGDDVIRRVGRLLSVNTRAADAVARYGGEEFVMILPDMTLEQAGLIAERLRIQIQAMAGLPDEVRVTASIGIAARMNGDTIESLLRRSDEALYSSKRAGRNRVCVQTVQATIPSLG